MEIELTLRLSSISLAVRRAGFDVAMNFDGDGLCLPSSDLPFARSGYFSSTLPFWSCLCPAAPPHFALANSGGLPDTSEYLLHSAQCAPPADVVEDRGHESHTAVDVFKLLSES